MCDLCLCPSVTAVSCFGVSSNTTQQKRFVRNVENRANILGLFFAASLDGAWGTWKECDFVNEDSFGSLL